MAGPKRGRGGKASAQAPEKVEGEPEIKVGKSEEDVKEETPKEEQISSETDQGEKEANAEEKPAAQEKAEEKKPVAKGKGKKGGKVEEPAVEEKTTEEEEPADAKTEETKQGKKDMAGPKRGRGDKASAQTPEKVEGEPEIKVRKSEEDVKEETPKEEQIVQRQIKENEDSSDESDETQGYVPANWYWYQKNEKKKLQKENDALKKKIKELQMKGKKEDSSSDE